MMMTRENPWVLFRASQFPVMCKLGRKKHGYLASLAAWFMDSQIWYFLLSLGSERARGGLADSRVRQPPRVRRSLKLQLEAAVYG